MTFEIREEPYDSVAAQSLIEEVQAEYVVRYGGPDETPVTPMEFARPDGRFVVGYLDGKPVAMGGLRRADTETLEVKRMYVVAAHRGRGFARATLAHLEQLAIDMGVKRVILETATGQPEAMSLYESSGYEPIAGFGHYRSHPESRCYAKTL